MTILSKEAQEALRAAAFEKLSQLEQTSRDDGALPLRSWIQSNIPAAERSHRCRFFDRAGFLHIPSFVDVDLCHEMKQCMSELVEQWDPETSLVESFATNDAANVTRGDYFLDSSDKIHFFCEASALEENNTLKPEYRGEKKLQSLNKVGHGLHLDPNLIFHRYCQSETLRELVLELGWERPVVPQSMYICKNAKTGSAVHSHQDSTFLFTTPKQSCLGLWLALDDANLSNGCLWVRPESHHEGIRRHYQRNGDYFEATPVVHDKNTPKFVMKQLETKQNIAWDGNMPDNDWQGLLDAGFVPIECQAGDLLVFCGELDHLSLPNESDRQRHTFQLHLIDGTTTWSPLNWLQTAGPFLPLTS